MYIYIYMNKSSFRDIFYMGSNNLSEGKMYIFARC